MTKPGNPKERNLIKGALRRVFSRSELRREMIAKTVIKHEDPSRPRVKKWSMCNSCLKPSPTYLMELDHKEPLIPLHLTLADLSWDEVIDRLWCNEENLVPICKTCHKEKSKAEMKVRRELKKKGKK